MKIGILGAELLQTIGGANDFIRNLLKALRIRPETTVYFICPKRDDETIYQYYLQAFPEMRRIYSECDQASLDSLWKTLNIDCFLLSIYPLGTELPYLTYWPDCQHRRFPEFFNQEAQDVRDARIRELLGTGKPMLINAIDAKNDMIRFFDADESRVFNLPVAPIVEFEHLFPEPELFLSYSLKKPFFICSNQFWIHKSLETFIEAANILVNEYLVDVNFVMTGKVEEPRFPDYPQKVLDLIKALDLEDRFRVLGHISKRSQLEVMKYATAVVQTTLFEGGPGGGSTYDAIGLGLRALVSDIPCNRELPDLPGQIFFYPVKNSRALADLMKRTLETPFTQPTIEQVYQISKRSIEETSIRLYEAIEAARLV